MLRSVEVGRIATSLLVVTLACGSERVEPQAREPSRVEVAIERELGDRVRVPMRVQCAWLPPSCRARLGDDTELRLVLAVKDGAIEWRVDGALVVADDLEAYLRDALADLGAPQVARCGARVRGLAAGERVECALQRGGKAFVIVNGDGSTAIEIQLDPTAGDARSEVVRDAELFQMSRKLEHVDEEDDD